MILTFNKCFVVFAMVLCVCSNFVPKKKFANSLQNVLYLYQTTKKKNVQLKITIMKTITLKDFQNYCNSFFYAVLEISENDNNFFAVIKTVKNTTCESVLKNFTQVEKVGRCYKVRLSKKDINNNLITNNFFNN